jgi:hypothetical protein
MTSCHLVVLCTTLTPNSDFRASIWSFQTTSRDLLFMQNGIQTLLVLLINPSLKVYTQNAFRYQFSRVTLTS